MSRHAHFARRGNPLDRYGHPQGSRTRKNRSSRNGTGEARHRHQARRRRKNRRKTRGETRNFHDDGNPFRNVNPYGAVRHRNPRSDRNAKRHPPHARSRTRGDPATRFRQSRSGSRSARHQGFVCRIMSFRYCEKRGVRSSLSTCCGGRHTHLIHRKKTPRVIPGVFLRKSQPVTALKSCVVG